MTKTILWHKSNRFLGRRRFVRALILFTANLDKVVFAILDDLTALTLCFTLKVFCINNKSHGGDNFTPTPTVQP